jgi:hypothetical protein
VARREAARPDNPWALLHGLLAFGPGFKASDGRGAWSVVAEHAARVGEPPRWDFPQTHEGMPVEPHDGTTVRILTVARPDGWSAPLGGRAGGPTPRELLVDAAHRLGEQAASGWPQRHDVGWSLGAVCAGAADGAPLRVDGVDLDAVARSAASLLKSECLALEHDRRHGAEEVKKDKKGIFTHPCGGLHLIQGLEVCAAAGVGGPEVRSAYLEQIDLLRWRLRGEIALYQRLRSANTGDGAVATILAIQQLKFAGHVLEALAQARVDGLVAVGGSEAMAFAADLGFAAEAVDEAAALLSGAGILADMDRLRVAARQQYFDLVGDACHALHGLDLMAVAAR